MELLTWAGMPHVHQNYFLNFLLKGFYVLRVSHSEAMSTNPIS